MLLIASYDYLTNHVTHHTTVIPTGRCMWRMQIWALGQDYDLDVELRPKKLLNFDELLPAINKEIDNVVDEIPAGVNLGWRVYQLPRKHRKGKGKKR